MPGDEIPAAPETPDAPPPAKVAMPGTPPSEIPALPSKPTAPEMEPVYLKDLLSPARLAAVGASLKAAETKQTVASFFNPLAQPGMRVNRAGKPDEDGWINADTATKVLQSIDDLDVREMVRKRIDEDNKQQESKFKALALKIKAYGEKVGGNRGFVMPDQRDQSIAADIEALRVNDPDSLDKLYKESNQKEREAKSQIRADERWRSQERLKGIYASIDLNEMKNWTEDDVQHRLLGSGLLGPEQRSVLSYYHALQREKSQEQRPLETAATMVRQRALDASHGNKRLADSRYGNAMQILMDEGWSAKYDPKALSDRLDKMFNDPGFLKRILDNQSMEADRPRQQRAPTPPAEKKAPTITGYRYNKDRSRRIPVYSNGTEGAAEEVP